MHTASFKNSYHVQRTCTLKRQGETGALAALQVIKKAENTASRRAFCFFAPLLRPTVGKIHVTDSHFFLARKDTFFEDKCLLV